MRLLPTLLLLTIPAMAPAQAFLRVGGGATMSTTLVGEVLQTPISQKQSLAPTGQLIAGWRFPSGYRVGAEVRYAHGTLDVDANGVADDLGRLATLQVGVMADGPLRGDFRWEAALGMLRYRPASPTGIFRDDSPAPLLVGGGVAWHRTVSRGFDLVVAARYDFHSFSTERLVRDGYSSSQGVHRGGVLVALEREF
jgi:hypothetical protein